MVACSIGRHKGRANRWADTVGAIVGLLIALVPVASGTARGGSEAASESRYVVNWYNQSQSSETRIQVSSDTTLAHTSMFSQKGEIAVHLDQEFGALFNLLGGPNNWETQIGLSELLRMGQIPDVFSFSKYLPVLAGHLQEGPPWPLSEVCAQISEDEVATYMPNTYMQILKAASEQGYDRANVWQQYYDGDKLFVVPRIYAKREAIFRSSGYPRAILWRNDLLRELGRPVPATIKQWTDVFQAYKQKYYHQPWVIVFPHIPVLDAVGASLFGWRAREGRLVPGFLHPDMRLALDTLKSWHEEGYVGSGGTQTQFILGNALVAAGVFYEDGDWICERPYWPGSIQEKCTRLNPAAEFVISPVPTFPGKGQPSVDVAGVFSTAVIGFGKHLEQDREKLHAVMRIVDMLCHDEELFLLANYGVEKKHWVWADEGGFRFPQRLEGARTRAEQNQLNIGPHWLQVYSPLVDRLLIHPRLRESRDQLCVGLQAAYSPKNVHWNRDSMTPYLNTEMANEYFAFALKYSQEVFQPIVFGWQQRSVDDAVIAAFLEEWEIHGKRIEDAVNQWYASQRH